MTRIRQPVRSNVELDFTLEIMAVTLPNAEDTFLYAEDDSEKLKSYFFIGV